MDRFMIGQFGHFDGEKYKRDFRQAFYGIEACLFQEEKDIHRLVELAERDGFHIVVHFPLRGWLDRLRDPQFFTKNEAKRQWFYQNVEEELRYLQKVKPEYVLFHYPKPVILDDGVDWSLWRFGDASEFIYESSYSYEELHRDSEKLFSWLSDKAEEYDFTPVLELDALNRYIYGTELIERLLARYPRVKLCLDIARLHNQASIDPSFDFKNIIKRFARYAEVIHVSNVRFQSNLEKNHFPALPDLDPAEGWADMAEYMALINQENSSAKLFFEHRSDLISEAGIPARDVFFARPICF
jgi:hypothetical protein